MHNEYNHEEAPRAPRHYITVSCVSIGQRAVTLIRHGHQSVITVVVADLHHSLSACPIFAPDPSSQRSRRLVFTRKCHPEIPQPQRRQRAQPNGQRLLCLQCTRHARAGKHEAGEEREFDAVRLSVRDAVAAQSIQCPNATTRREGRNRACAHVARDATACSQAGEDVGDGAEGLGLLVRCGGGGGESGRMIP